MHETFSEHQSVHWRKKRSKPILRKKLLHIQWNSREICEQPITRLRRMRLSQGTRRWWQDMVLRCNRQGREKILKLRMRLSKKLEKQLERFRDSAKHFSLKKGASRSSYVGLQRQND